MNHKTIGTLALAAVLVTLLCTAFAQQPVPAEPKPVPADNHIGRYQITGLDSNNNFALVDTHTGQCWVKGQGQPWRDQGTQLKAME